MTKSSKNKEKRYYAPDLLLGRFDVTQINKVWTSDDVYIPLKNEDKHLRILHVVDLSSRKILATLVTTKDFNAAHIVRTFTHLLISEQVQEFDDETKRLIIHTDRDTHFRSKTWWDMFRRNPKKLRISMSPESTPKSNAVSERINWNVKHMGIPVNDLVNSSMKTYLPLNLLNVPENANRMQYYKKVVRDFVTYYNEKHVHRMLKTTLDLEHVVHQVAEPIVGDSSVIAVRNNISSLLEDRVAVVQYKELLHKTYEKTLTLANDVNKDSTNDYLLHKLQSMIQTETRKLAYLNHTQYLSVSEDLQKIQQTIEKIEKRLEKKTLQHVTLPLRDPIVYSIYEKLMNYPLYTTNPLKLLSLVQFKIVAVVLYLTGSRVNEIIDLTYDDFIDAKKTHRISTIQHKTKQPRICILGEKALEQLNKIEEDIDFIFIKNKFKYLGATLQHPEKPMHSTAWTRSINKNLKRLASDCGIALTLKSHSFRVGFVTRHLKVTDIEKTANLIGHKSLNTTKRYNRYTLNTEENRLLTDKSFLVD